MKAPHLLLLCLLSARASAGFHAGGGDEDEDLFQSRLPKCCAEGEVLGPGLDECVPYRGQEPLEAHPFDAQIESLDQLPTRDGQTGFPGDNLQMHP